jgi:hypothetical protein
MSCKPERHEWKISDEQRQPDPGAACLCGQKQWGSAGPFSLTAADERQTLIIDDLPSKSATRTTVGKLLGGTLCSGRFGSAECDQLSGHVGKHTARIGWRDDGQQPEARPTRWTAVEASVPQSERRVLVYAPKFSPSRPVTTGSFSQVPDEGWCLDDGGDGAHVYDGDVTHWMPLPDPPDPDTGER